MELTRWKLIAGGAALVGVAVGGVAGAASDDGFDLNDRRAAIALAADDGSSPADAELADDSPESADSPNESVADSAESPFDSPDDPDWVDPSPESADSPNDSVADSANSPSDSPDDPGWVAPAPPPPPPPPAPSPAPVYDDSASAASAGSYSVDSPDSAGSD